MPRPSSRVIGGVVSLLLGVAGVAGATATGHQHPDSKPGVLARDFAAVDRNTTWTLADKMHLGFETFHTEGLAVTPNHLFLSSVEIIEPTKKYPSPVGGYDRTPGKGVGHLFVMNRRGDLQKDIVLGSGDMYHPGGISFDGTDVWVPVAQYRPDSSSIIYRVDARTLDVHRQFEVDDHIGGIVRDETSHHLVGNTWGSRRFNEWQRSGRQVDTWDNDSHFVDYQDCQYVPSARMICGGVTNLEQTPTAGGPGASYELGGMALLDLRTHRILHEVPFQKWSAAGHVMTRNPLKLVANGHRIDLWAAPDNGEETNGTEVFHYRADVDPER